MVRILAKIAGIVGLCLLSIVAHAATIQASGPISLSVSPVSMQVNQTYPVQVVVKNTSVAAITLDKMTLTSPTRFIVASSTCNEGVVLNAQQTCVYSGSFTPFTVGTNTWSVSAIINNTGPYAASASAQVSSAPVVLLTPSLSGVGTTVPESSVASKVSFILTNNNKSAVTVKMDGQPSYPANFIPDSSKNTCIQTTLQPGYSCHIDGQFTPNILGVSTWTVPVQVSGQQTHSYTKSVTVKPTPATINLTPSMQGVSTTVGQSSTPVKVAFVLTNTMPNKSVTVAKSGPYSFPKTFTVDTNNDTCFGKQTSIVLNSGSSCHINGAFIPSELGKNSWQVHMQLNGQPTVSYTEFTTVQPSTLSLTPSLTGVTQPVTEFKKYSKVTFTLTNNNSVPVTLGPSTGMAYPKGFNITTDSTCKPGKQLAAKDTCFVVGDYTPSTTAVDTNTFSLASSLNGAPSKTFSIPVTVTAPPPAPGDLEIDSENADNASFLYTRTGGTSTGTVVLINKGKGPVTSISVTPTASIPGVSVATDDCNNKLPLQPGDTCQATISYTPTDEPSQTIVSTNLNLTVNGQAIKNYVLPVIDVKKSALIPLGVHQGLSQAISSNSIHQVYLFGDDVYIATSNGLDVSNDKGQHFTQLTTLNGLGSNNILSVVAGITDGSHWQIFVGTTNGISITDEEGYTFRNYNQVDATHLPSKRIQSLLAYDSDDNKRQALIIGTDNGLAISSNLDFDDNTTFAIKQQGSIPNTLAGKNVTAMSNAGSDDDPDAYVAVAHNHGVSITTMQRLLDPNSGLGIFDNIWGGDSASTVYAVQKGSTEATFTLYIGTPEGLVVGDVDNNQMSNTHTYTKGANQLAGNNVSSIYSNGSYLYVGTDGGLSTAQRSIQPLSFTSITKFNDVESSPAVTSIGETQYGIQYIGLKNGGVMKGDDTTNLSSIVSNGLPDGNINAMTFDPSSKALYIGTDAGLAVSTDGGVTFKNYTNKAALGSNQIKAIVIQNNTDGTETICIGSAGGFYIFDPKTGSFTDNSLGNKTLEAAQINTAALDASGGLLLGTQSNGIFSLPKGASSYIQYTMPTDTSKPGLGSNTIQGIATASGITYFATANGLAVMAMGTGDITNIVGHGLATSNLEDVYYDPATDNVYVATQNGLAIATSKNIQSGSFTFDNITADGLPSAGISSVNMIGKTLFVGTHEGLAISENNGQSFETTLNSTLLGFTVKRVTSNNTQLYVGTDQNGVYTGPMP